MNIVNTLDASVPVPDIETLTFPEQRNEQSISIGRLPTELIVNILKWAQLLSTNRSVEIHSISALDIIFPETPYCMNYGWLRITATCRRWRDAALQCRQLWQIVNVNADGRWRNICAQRAQGLPLILLANIRSRHRKSPKYREKERFLIAHLLQAVEATLSELDQVNFPNIFNDMKCDSLTHLKLDSYLFSMDASFMGGSLPSLASLDLNIDSVKAWPHCPNLRHMKLTVWFPATHSTGRKLMECLDRTTKLEVLYLDFIWSPRSGMIIPSEYQTHGSQGLLPALRILKLKVRNITTCLELLRAFPSPSIGLDVSFHDMDLDDLKEDATLQCAYNDVTDHLTQYWASRTQIPLQAHVILSNKKPSTFQLTSSLDAPYDLNRPFCILYGPYVPGAFSPHHSVKTLQLEGARVGLKPTEPGEDSDPDGIVHMECLDTIILKRIKTVKHVNLLGTWLINRKQSGHGIRLLSIYEPATAETREALEFLSTRLLQKQVVQAVEWSP
jgi:hypothetical protein